LIREAITRRGFLRRLGAERGDWSWATAAGRVRRRRQGRRAGGGAVPRRHGARTRARPPDLELAPLYIDKQTGPGLREGHGGQGRVTEDINDNGEFFAKDRRAAQAESEHRPRRHRLTDWMAGRLIKLGYVAPLDDAKFPNKANLVDAVKDVSFDPAASTACRGCRG